MFGIGIPELILIAVVALIVVGPKDLPVTLRAIGRAIREFQRASRELRKEAGFDEVVDEVTRPLREGLAGIEADVLRESEDTRYEYPEGGPDDYDALPEGAGVYPELEAQGSEDSSAGAPPKLSPGGTVSRKAKLAKTRSEGVLHEDPIIAAKLRAAAEGQSGLTREAIIAAKLAAPLGTSPFAPHAGFMSDLPTGPLYDGGDPENESLDTDDPVVSAKLEVLRARDAAVRAKLAAVAEPKASEGGTEHEASGAEGSASEETA